MSNIPIVDTPLAGQVVVNKDGTLMPQFYALLESISRIINAGIQNGYTVATVPDAAESEQGLIYVSDESGGATLAFSDGTNWRRVQDRVIIS
jgi:hypothetical protein